MRQVIALVFVMAAATTARAATEDLELARMHFQAGVDAYDSGKYEVALREFQESHALSHNAELYFNMAACEEHLDHFQAAALLLRQYLVEKPTANDRAKVEARIKVLEERDAAIHRPPEPVMPRTMPGPKVVEQPPPPPVPLGKRYLGGFIMTGVTAALAIGWIATGALAVTQHSSLKSGCGSTAAGCSSSDVDTLKTYDLVADVFMGLTIASAITTVILFVIESRKPAASFHASAPSRLRVSGGMIGWSF